MNSSINTADFPPSLQANSSEVQIRTPRSFRQNGENPDTALERRSNLEQLESFTIPEPSFEAAVKLVPYHEPFLQERYRDMDFSSLREEFTLDNKEVTKAIKQVFRQLGLPIEDAICADIAFAAQPLITGYWYTTGTVYLYQHVKSNEVVGKFLDFLIVGKVFGKDLIIHQYHPWGHVLTLWLQLDERHCALEGYFWRKWKPQQKSQITFQRRPYVYQKALNYASSGHLSKLMHLIDEEKFDINLQKSEAQMFTLLHAAVACDQPAVVHFLLKRGADLSKEDENGESALRLAKRFHFPHLVNLIEAAIIDELPDEPPEREVSDTDIPVVATQYVVTV